MVYNSIFLKGEEERKRGSTLSTFKQQEPDRWESGGARRSIVRNNRQGARAGAMKGKRLKAVDERRTCATRGCTTRLSCYNKQEHCFQHQPLTYPKFFRGEKVEHPDQQEEAS